MAYARRSSIAYEEKPASSPKMNEELNGIYTDLNDLEAKKLVNVVEDTTPQLGGNLDLNSKSVGDAVAADFTKLHGITATKDEVNLLDGSVAGTAVASKALVLGANKEVDECHVNTLYLGADAGTALTATAAELNKLAGLATTKTELGYVNGVTSAIQTQLDAKLENLSEDTTPELGGNLNCGSKTAYFSEVNDDANSTINWNAGNKHKKTLSDDVTLAFTAPSGPTNLVLRVIQDSTARAITWPAAVEWVDATEPDYSTVSKVYVFTFYYDGAKYRGAMSGPYDA